MGGVARPTETVPWGVDVEVAEPFSHQTVSGIGNIEFRFQCSWEQHTVTVLCEVWGKTFRVLGSPRFWPERVLELFLRPGCMMDARWRRLVVGERNGTKAQKCLKFPPQGGRERKQRTTANSFERPHEIYS